MKIVNSFSGGRTSAYDTINTLCEYGVENVDIVYMCTGAEHPKTYKFIREFNAWLESVFGKSITCLRLVVTPELGSANSYEVVSIEDIKFDLAPFKAMLKKYGVPYISGMFCTDRLKLVPYNKYCDENYGVDSYETYIGIRADEPKRVWGDHKQKKYSTFKLLSEAGYEHEDMIELWRKMHSVGLNVGDVSELVNGDKWLARQMIKRYYETRVANNIRYMAERSDAEKQDVLDFWSTMPFDLEIPEWSGNCVFCPKKSDLKLAAAQRDNPELYALWVEMLNSTDVRVDDNTGKRDNMYRKNRSLEQVIATFDDSTGDEIKARIRGGHMVDTNSCSESCDVLPEGVRV